MILHSKLKPQNLNLKAQTSKLKPQNFLYNVSSLAATSGGVEVKRT
jgi:hypothetical protein